MNLSELQTIVAAGEGPRLELKRSTGELRRGAMERIDAVPSTPRRRRTR